MKKQNQWTLIKLIIIIINNHNNKSYKILLISDLNKFDINNNKNNAQ